MAHARGALLGLCILAARAASGQEHKGDFEELTASSGKHFGAGAGWSALLGPTATAEFLYGFGADVRDDGDRVRGVLGVLAQVHAGADGAKLSLGVGGRARVDSDDWKGMAATGVKLSLARTWREPDRSRRTYLGPELDFCVKHVAFGLGPLFKVAGRGSPVLFSWNVGLRL